MHRVHYSCSNNYDVMSRRVDTEIDAVEISFEGEVNYRMYIKRKK